MDTLRIYLQANCIEYFQRNYKDKVQMPHMVVGE